MYGVTLENLEAAEIALIRDYREMASSAKRMIEVTAADYAREFPLRPMGMRLISLNGKSVLHSGNTFLN